MDQWTNVTCKNNKKMFWNHRDNNLIKFEERTKDRKKLIKCLNEFEEQQKRENVILWTIK